MIESAELLQLVDWMDQGVLLVTPAAILVHANRIAQSLLGAADGLSAAGGVVACHRADETGRLRRSIRAVSAVAAALPALLVAHRPSGRRPLSLLVAPLGGGEALAPDRPGACILVNDADRIEPATERHLLEMYDLTRAEARTALALLDADRLQDIADRFGVSLSAIRIHLQRVYEKTDTHRQAELVRLLLAHHLPRVMHQLAILGLAWLVASLAAA